jgi:voltage-gated potassium channel
MWGRRLPEGRGENLLSTSALPADLRRAARRFWIALLFLLLLMAFAAAIYVNVESRISGAPWTIIDAVYMAVITIATIGFMEVHPLSQFGRAFTTGFAITGIILAAVAVRSAASLLLGEQLSHEFERRRRVRALRYVRDHYIVCGYGRMGREAVTQLRRRGLSVVVIEHEADGLDRLREGGILYVEGNATQDESLKSAGVERAKVLIAAVATDEDNLFVVLSARLLNPSLYIIARAGQEGAVDKLTRAGANRVLSPYVVGGRNLAAAAAEPGVVDFLEMVLHREDLDVEITSLPISSDAHVAGISLAAAGLMREDSAMILAIADAEGNFHTNPRHDSVLRPGDRLIAMGSRAQLIALRQLIR